MVLGCIYIAGAIVFVLSLFDIEEAPEHLYKKANYDVKQ